MSHNTLFVASIGRGRPFAIGTFERSLRARVAEMAGVDPGDVTIEEVQVVQNIPKIRVQPSDLRVAQVRATDPKTSRAARDAAIDFASGQWARILAHFLAHHDRSEEEETVNQGLTASEVDHALAMTPSSCSKRLGELERAGFLRVEGSRQSRRSPRQQAVYHITWEGLFKARYGGDVVPEEIPTAGQERKP